MKTIGLIGGMSWESTVPYYRLINEGVKARLGGLHSSRLLLYNVDFAEIEECMRLDKWQRIAEVLSGAAGTLEAAGADCVVLCSNSVHRVAAEIEASIDVPFLHIVDVTGAAIQAAGFTRVGLLGTRFVMEQDFYSGRLAKHGLEVMTPEDADRGIVHRVIFEELVLGKVIESSRNEYRRIMKDLAHKGAQGIILGCTEIGMLVSPEDSPIPLFDTTAIHARAIIDWALAE
ncbi:MAG: aspartate/glutamate racemase family protein [Armatimonadetes bacterium]|nr:aspartate/glutamate racemase family protein [Armatimonadota bacterium]